MFHRECLLSPYKYSNVEFIYSACIMRKYFFPVRSTTWLVPFEDVLMTPEKLPNMFPITVRVGVQSLKLKCKGHFLCNCIELVFKHANLDDFAPILVETEYFPIKC